MARPQRRSRRFDSRRRRKVSFLTKEKIDYIDYKDVTLLRRFISDRAKIRPRRVTGNNEQQQRAVALAIKNAREMALLPYENRITTLRRSSDRRGSEDSSPRGAASHTAHIAEDVAADVAEDVAAEAAEVTAEAVAEEAIEDVAAEVEAEVEADVTAEVAEVMAEAVAEEAIEDVAAEVEADVAAEVEADVTAEVAEVMAEASDSQEEQQ